MTMSASPRSIPVCRGRAPALLLAAAAVFTTACASTGAVPRPFPTPRVASAPPITETPVVPAGPSAPEAAGPERAAEGGGVAATDGLRGSARPGSCATCAPVDAYAVTGTALTLRGVPYRYGGTDPGGFDCSGFTRYVFGQHGILLPRDVKDQFEAGRPVQPTEIEAGDLVFFSTVAPGASHVAIALGGEEFVHAPSTTGVVRVERLGSTYWSQRFVGARRVN
jgi:hypothetical protein